jgi:hypothetical protein
MTTDALLASPLTCELLLQIFDPPVSFHRCLVPISGGVTAALMLSQAIWTSEALDPAQEGWFSKSQEEWMEDTGLSRWELESARRSLRGAGLLQERRAGLPARLWYRVCQEQVGRALRERASLRGGREVAG